MDVFDILSDNSNYSLNGIDVCCDCGGGMLNYDNKFNYSIVTMNYNQNNTNDNLELTSKCDYNSEFNVELNEQDILLSNIDLYQLCYNLSYYIENNYQNRFQYDFNASTGFENDYFGTNVLNHINDLCNAVLLPHWQLNNNTLNETNFVMCGHDDNTSTFVISTIIDPILDSYYILFHEQFIDSWNVSIILQQNSTKMVETWSITECLDFINGKYSNYNNVNSIRNNESNLFIAGVMSCNSLFRQSHTTTRVIQDAEPWPSTRGDIIILVSICCIIVICIVVAAIAVLQLTKKRKPAPQVNTPSPFAPRIVPSMPDDQETMELNQRCTICQDDMISSESRTPMVQLACNHKFHDNCWTIQRIKRQFK